MPANWRGDGLVLVVDDDEEVRIIAGEMFTSFGFRVLTAQNGREAIELFDEHVGVISTVLLDATMPDMNGSEVLIELRRMCSITPVILTSGYSKEDAIGEVIKEKAVHFIQKPYRPSELMCLVHQAMKDS